LGTFLDNFFASRHPLIWLSAVYLVEITHLGGPSI